MAIEARSAFASLQAGATHDRAIARLTSLEDEVNQLYEHVPFGSHVLDADGTYLEINSLALEWLGYSREQIIGKRKWAEFLTQASRELLQAHIPDQSPNHFVMDIELDMVRSDGTRFPVSVSSKETVDNDGKLLKRRAVMVDLRERRKNKVDELVAATAFESLSAMYVADREHTILRVNHAFTALTGHSAQWAVGRTLHRLRSGPRDKALCRSLRDSLVKNRSWQGEISGQRNDGQIYDAALSVSSVLDAKGEVTHYIGSCIDISASKKAEAGLLQLAYFDPLTQLPNRRLLLDRCAHALATEKRSGLYGAILFIDLDHFKMINDTRGHEAGDLLLIETARRLRGAVRESDSVARLGGDEFVVLLEGLDTKLKASAAQAKTVGEKILHLLDQPYAFSGYEFHCSASIGIELFLGEGLAADLLLHADLAMYQAKKAGRNALTFFNNDMQAAVNSRGSMKADLRHALRLDQFELHYQPQVNLQGQIVGAEALLRWQTAERGQVSPATFIPLAEESGLIVAIGQWVLETACARLKAWESNPLACDLQLAVNVSAHQFRQDNFVARVQQVLHNSGVNPARLELEITESTVLDVDDAIAKMHALRKLGVKFSMDDFGTGHSSLSSLARLPLGQLKIDQSFVGNLGVQPTAAIIVQAISAMANALDMGVIAEGVETAAQRAILKQHGVQVFQGYYFSRPLPIEAFERLLREGVPLLPE